MRLDIASLADQPSRWDLWSQLDGLWPTFMTQDPTGDFYFSYLLEHFPAHCLLAIDRDTAAQLRAQTVGDNARQRAVDAVNTVMEWHRDDPGDRPTVQEVDPARAALFERLDAATTPEQRADLYEELERLDARRDAIAAHWLRETAGVERPDAT